MRHQLFGLFVTLLASLQIHMGSAIKIEIVPKEFKGGASESTVMVTCSLDEKEKDAKTIVFIKIARKGGRGLVWIHGNSTIEFGNAEEDEVAVTGAIGSDLLKSTLSMEIKEPETEDTGVYICSATYTGESGAQLINKANDKLSVDDPEVKKINSKVNELLEKVKKEQDELKVIKEKEKKDKSKVVDLEVKAKKQEGEITDLVEKEKEVENKVTALEEKTEKQLKKIEELSNKEETEVKSLKSTIKNLVDKMKKDEEEIENIGAKEAEDKVKVTDLEEKAETQTKELQELADKEKKVETKVMTLEKDTKDALKKVQELAKKETSDKSKVNNLEEKAEKQSKDLESLETREKDVETRMEDLEDRIETFLKKVDDLKSKVNDNKVNNNKVTVTKPATNNRRNWNTKDTPISAFSATIQRGYTKVNKGQTIVFPDIVMQSGMEGYNSRTGIFSAPADGLYHFSLVLKVNCISCYARVALMAGNKMLFRLKVGVIYDENQNSASSVALLKKNEKVKAFVDYSSEGAVLTPNRLCLFSGYLAQAM